MSKSRMKMGNNKDKRVFTGTAGKTHVKNIARQNSIGIMRGGYRL